MKISMIKKINFGGTAPEPPDFRTPLIKILATPLIVGVR